MINRIPHTFTLVLILFMSACTIQHQFENRQVYQILNQASPHYAAIDQGQLEYYQFGRGSPIVLIPGYVTDITSWNKPFLSALAQKHQLIVFNNRNVGGSYVNASHYQSQDLAKDIHQLIKKLHLKKPAIVGLSMGGMIAQQLAVRYPQDIGQLILINTAIAGKQSVRPSPTVEKLILNMPTNKLGRYLLARKLFFPKSERTAMGQALIFDRFQPKKYTEINPRSVISEQRQLILQWAQDDTSAKKIKSSKSADINFKWRCR